VPSPKSQVHSVIVTPFVIEESVKSTGLFIQFPGLLEKLAIGPFAVIKLGAVFVVVHPLISSTVSDTS
jgi:hypothetical protein